MKKEILAFSIILLSSPISFSQTSCENILNSSPHQSAIQLLQDAFRGGPVQIQQTVRIKDGLISLLPNSAADREGLVRLLFQADPHKMNLALNDLPFDESPSKFASKLISFINMRGGLTPESIQSGPVQPKQFNGGGNNARPQPFENVLKEAIQHSKAQISNKLKDPANRIEATFFNARETLQFWDLHSDGKTRIFVHRESTGTGLDILRLYLTKPLPLSVKTSVDNLPPTYRMHGSIGPEATQALKNTGLEQTGIQMMMTLYNHKVAKPIPDVSLRDRIEEMKALQKQGYEPRRTDEVLIDSNNATPEENLDLQYLSALGNSGPAGAFEIRLGVPESTMTEDVLLRIMVAIKK